MNSEGPRLVASAMVTKVSVLYRKNLKIALKAQLVSEWLVRPDDCVAV